MFFHSASNESSKMLLTAGKLDLKSFLVKYNFDFSLNNVDYL